MPRSETRRIFSIPAMGGLRLDAVGEHIRHQPQGTTAPIPDMAGFPSPFGGTDDGETFDDYGEFVPEHLPNPGGFLDGHRVLSGAEHTAFHERTRELFEERKVYDMTFDYNLARLNLDTRHPSAGYRYAEERDDPSVLRAEFTPTTPFCPQTHTLTIGSFRAWNGLSERHGYDLVRVRAADVHHRSASINDELEAVEAEYLESGSVDGNAGVRAGASSVASTGGDERPGRGDPGAPF